MSETNNSAALSQSETYIAQTSMLLPASRPSMRKRWRDALGWLPRCASGCGLLSICVIADGSVPDGSLMLGWCSELLRERDIYGFVWKTLNKETPSFRQKMIKRDVPSFVLFAFWLHRSA